MKLTMYKVNIIILKSIIIWVVFQQHFFLQYFTNIKLTEHTKKLCICISPNSLTFAVFVKQQAHEAYKALREEL